MKSGNSDEHILQDYINQMDDLKRQMLGLLFQAQKNADQAEHKKITVSIKKNG